MMMNVLIVEDESLAAEKLELMLKEIDSSINVLAKCGSIKESVKWLMEHTADLIFLDIQLSDGISFSIFEQVIINTPIIFTTAYDQYAIRAFQLNSVAYLLKPIRKSDLVESLRKYQTLKSAFSIDFDALVANLQGREPEYKKRFMIQIGEKIRKIEVAEVAYFYVLEKGIYLKTFQGNSYPVEFTLDRLEAMLNPEKFFRINRKYMVNMDSIANMVAYSRGRIKLELKPKADDEFDTIVSVDRSADFKKWLNS
jgi:DNA-binding LytR/AlgR family response regulator